MFDTPSITCPDLPGDVNVLRNANRGASSHGNGKAGEEK